MIIADTSGLLALFNRAEPRHEEVRRLVEAERDPPVVSPYVVAELDYLVYRRLGAQAALAVLRELTAGAYDLAELGAADVRATTDVVERYLDQQVGVTDASLVVLAHLRRTDQVLTLDRRHFDVLRPLRGGHFQLLPG